MSCLKFEFKRLFKSKKNYIAIIVGLIVSFLQIISSVHNNIVYEHYVSNHYEDMKNFYYPTSVFNTYLGMDSGFYTVVLYFILPILAIMPFGCSYFTDKKTGYLKLICTLTNKRHYYMSKLLVTFFSGFLITFIIFGSNLYITSMIFPAIRPESITMTFEVIGKQYLWNEMYLNHPFCYAVLFILIDSLFIGLLNTVSLIISIIADNKLVVFLTPVVLYVGLSYLFSSINLPELSPLNFLSALQPVPCNIVFVILSDIILTVMSLVFFVAVGVKKDVY